MGCNGSKQETETPKAPPYPALDNSGSYPEVTPGPTYTERTVPEAPAYPVAPTYPEAPAYPVAPVYPSEPPPMVEPYESQPAPPPMPPPSSYGTTKFIPRDFSKILDNYETFEQLNKDFYKNSFEVTNLMLGIDFTASNKTAGGGRENTNGKFGIDSKNLHTIIEGKQNQYQLAIKLFGDALEHYDPDNLIPTYIFGDVNTRNEKVMNIKDVYKKYMSEFGKQRTSHYESKEEHCKGVKECLEVYTELTKNDYIKMSGPTCISKLIERAIEYSSRKVPGEHVTLVILADGAITPICIEDSKKAIIRARRFPISIVMIGVGNGPFDTMEDFDDKIKGGEIDNFQFVNMNEIIDDIHNEDEINKFILQTLMEIPQQVEYFRYKGILK